MALAYLGTSDFAVDVLERLAAAREAPALVVTPPDRPRGRRRRPAPPPAAAAAGRLGIRLHQTGNVNDPASLEAIRSANADVALVCAFGQIIREPLLSDLELLNVHPSLLPRWRGAAPIERAIMAGDERTGVSIARVTAGLDSGPVALSEEVEIGAEEDYGSLAARLGELGAELAVKALRARRGGELELHQQPEEGATYAEKIDPAERRLDPSRAAVELARIVRALTPHIGAHLELAGGERLGVSSARAGEDGPPPGALAAVGGSLLVGCSAGSLRIDRVKPAGGARDELRRLPARSPASRSGPLMASAARGVAFDVVRRTFEEGAYTDLAFAAAARRAGLEDRERAQAQRLAYGAVQRRGTADALIAELSGRPTGRVQAPLLAALRIGIYEVLFAGGTPAHAAVSEAVELAKRSGSRRGARVRQRHPPARRERGRGDPEPLRRVDSRRRRGRALLPGVAL